MYDADRIPDPWESPWPDPPPGFDARLRLTHLVLVDGRLVDVWSEPAEGTRWQHHAERLDRALRRHAEPPPPPPYQRVLDALALLLDRDAAELRATYLPVVRELVDQGFLSPA